MLELQDKVQSEGGQAAHLCEHAAPGESEHRRFPTAEELDEQFGEQVGTFIELEYALMAYERSVMRLARHHFGGRATPDVMTPLTTFASIAVQPRPSDAVKALIEQTFFDSLGTVPRPDRLFPALQNRRTDHRTWGTFRDKQGRTQNDRFNIALEKAYRAGTYQQLAAIHAQAAEHRIHSTQGPVGTQRFLPWHRLYLLKLETLLKSYEPTVQIPYWDFATDHERPDWVWKPPGVERPTPGGALLPSESTVDSIVLTNSFYTEFTSQLEGRAHNNVHNWCGGTLRNPATSAQDPIFWLLHANVDRIWDRWQLTHTGIPMLNGQDAVLDPWGPTSATDVDSVLALGYSYPGSRAPFMK